MSEIVNRVANSGIITLDLGEYYPEGSRTAIDLKDQLWQEIALKEKDFRDWISENDWSQFEDHHVSIFCSADAIIPSWAYMLVGTALEGIAKTVHYGDLESLENQLWSDALADFSGEKYQDARIVIKGCGDRPTPPSAFISITNKLKPFVKSIMYGEPCSTVPIWKRRG